MRALNRKEIRQKSLNFWLQFGVLVSGMLLVVYFFVWSSIQEQRSHLSLLQAYKQVENQQVRMRFKADSLYWYLGRLAPGRTTDEKFLVAVIRDQRRAFDHMATADSSGSFKGYTAITRHLDAQLRVRDTIIRVERRNADMRHSLEACISGNGRLREVLHQLK